MKKYLIGWQLVLHDLFEAGVLLKGLNALTELVFGFALLFFDVSGLIQRLIENALIEDPDNFLATHLQPFAHSLSPHAELYSALYLLSHGVIKMALVWGLVRERAWAFPASLAVLGLFVAYQTIQFLSTHSLLLIWLDVFDLIIIVLIWVEYQRVLAQKRL